MLHTSAEHSATQKEGIDFVDSNGRIRNTNKESNDPVVSKPVSNTQSADIVFLAISQILDLRFIPANRCQIELIGAKCQLRRSRDIFRCNILKLDNQAE